MNRRDLFKFLAGIGLGAVAIETYERLYHIPMLETMFRKELEYWINQYNTAREEVERLTKQLRKREDEISSLRSELARSKEELEHLIQQYNTTKEEVSRLSEMLKQSEEEINSLKEKVGYWEARYNTAREEVGRLNSIINKIDELERESTSAIEYYRGRMDEAIRNLREVIERYRVLLGDERVSFESSTLKILEDLRLAEERLQRVLPYFPLILNLYWRPMRVVNDKIYDVNVVFEVISPLSSLEVVEVTLRPVEYKYFITMYGMREEDYNKVFPEEDVRIVRIKPLQTGRMVFSVDFKDLKGGREYFIEVRVRDTAGNEKRVAVKTPYIRQFENFGRELYEKGIIVAGSYYLWWGPEYWAHNSPLTLQPLLGWYDLTDQMVISKHIDIFTGYGIKVFFISWSGRYDEPTYYHDRRLKDIFINNSLISDVKFVILYETHGRLKKDKDGFIDLNDEENKKKFIEDFEYLSKNYFPHPSYLKVGGRPVVYIYDTPVFTLKTKNVEEVINEMRKRVKILSGYDIYIVSSEVNRWFDPNEFRTQERLKLFECNSDWAAQYGGTIGVDDWFMNNYDENMLKVYQAYSKVLEELKKDFMPSTIPGFRCTRIQCYTQPHIIVERDVERFNKRLKYALSTTHSNRAFIRLDTLNDHHEDTQIEPTVEEGYKFLETLYRILKDFLNNI